MSCMGAVYVEPRIASNAAVSIRCDSLLFDDGNTLNASEWEGCRTHVARGHAHQRHGAGRDQRLPARDVTGVAKRRAPDVRNPQPHRDVIIEPQGGMVVE